MTLGRITFQPGKPIVEQVVFAATRAFVSGAMRPGDSFPSVRALASDLKIHPNTAHKAIQQLVREGWLEVHPGKGTLVAERPETRGGEQLHLLNDRIDHLVVEAKSLNVSLSELRDEIDRRWEAIDPQETES